MAPPKIGTSGYRSQVIPVAATQPDVASLDSNWMDDFHRVIMERDYERAKEILRAVRAEGGDSGENQMVNAYAETLQDFLEKLAELDAPPIEKVGSVEFRFLNDLTGRGLRAPLYLEPGSTVWQEQPLVYVQSPWSKRKVKCCLLCWQPLGTLETQLLHMDLMSPAGAESVQCVTGDGAAEVVNCAGCDSCFCSQACHDIALSDSPHKLLCKGKLSSEQQEALSSLEELARSGLPGVGLLAGNENLLLLVHTLASMLVTVQQGWTEDVVKHRYFNRFVTRAWDELASSVDDPDDNPAIRRQVLSKATEYLRTLFLSMKGAGDLLQADVLSGLMGTFELTAMSVCLDHTLNSKKEEVLKILGDEGCTSLRAFQKRNVSQEEEGDKKDNEEEEQEQEVLFDDVEGISLLAPVAFTNHNCLPNCAIHFSSKKFGSDSGPANPGIWALGMATRPILPDDEVTMSYYPSVVGQPYCVRQQKMKDFGFQCRCSCCMADEANKDPVA